MSDFNNSPKDSLKILQFTDTHLYRDLQGSLFGINTYESFKHCLERAYKLHWPADLVLATGDLTHDASSEAYRHLQSIFNSIECDICAIPGNHDNTETFAQVLTGNNIVPEKYYLQGNWLLVMLDSSIADSEAGNLEKNEIDHLEDCLKKYPDHHALICLHHPPVAVGSAWMDTMMLQNTQEFFNVIDRHANIKIVLWGHIHQQYESTYNDITLLASPSTCVQFLPLSNDFAVDDLAPGYRWLTLHSDGTFDTGIERLDSIPSELDHQSTGY